MPDLATIEQDIRGALTDATDDVKRVIETHLPALLGAAAAVDADPLVQAAQAALLPPLTRQAIADLITKAASEFPQPAAAAAGASDAALPPSATVNVVPADPAAAPPADTPAAPDGTPAPAAPAGPTIAGAAT
jgi:hypothetical protein